MSNSLSRRSFLKLVAAAGAAATLPGCEPAPRQLVSYVVPDENVIPGVPSFYATTCAECPAGCGLVAKVREGRAIKLEGNPLDPISAGSICARGQAALQGIYNPDRLALPRRRAADGSLHPISWDEASRLLDGRLRAGATAGGERVAFVGTPRGPTFNRIVAAWLGAWHSSRLVYYEPLSGEPARAAAEFCFQRRDLPVYRLDRAEFIVSFGADFLETWGSPVEMTRQYAAFRAPIMRYGALTTGRSAYVGPRFSLTAARCDDWIATRPGTEAAVALGVLNALVNQGWVPQGPAVDLPALKNFVAGYEPAAVAARTGVPAGTIAKLGQWFGKAHGAVALAGTDDKAAHVAAAVLNAATGNLGKTVLFLERAPLPEPSPAEEVKTLVDAMRQGTVDVLVVAGGNPVFSMPPSAGFLEAMRRVPFVVWCGGVPDETAAIANLLLPIHHQAESWSDATPRAAVYALSQPVMQPVFDSRPLGDILLDSARSAGPAGRSVAWESAAEAVEASFRELYAARGGGGAGFIEAWQRAKQHGGIFEQPEIAAVQLQPAALKPSPLASPGAAPSDDLTLIAYPHIFLYDGRGADKPWLQEIPEPVSQFVWGSWAEIHPDTAKRLGIAANETVELRTANGVIETPAYLSPRVHPGAVAVPIGQGHAAYGRYARGRGANPWRALSPGAMTAAVKVRRTGARHQLVSPLGMSNMLGRPIIETVALGDLAAGLAPEAKPPAPEPYEMYERYQYPKHKWGMTIDLNACTGCSACVAACYAENNLPFVGREAVADGRIMSWIRVERFFRAEAGAAPALYIAPMLCQQCDRAPCEPVCPVFAAYHTDEGLNGQVYNRCVGTRYCENNCPYKVRRFNWFAPEWPKPFDLQLNPDVTVRGAGVMEKCTFCIQRIVAAEIDAAIAKRPVRDGEIVPACAEACPAHAISFGDMNEAQSAMMRRRADNRARNYRAFDDLNVEPAIVYLRDIRRGKRRV